MFFTTYQAVIIEINRLEVIGFALTNLGARFWALGLRQALEANAFGIHIQALHTYCTQLAKFAIGQLPRRIQIHKVIDKLILFVTYYIELIKHTNSLKWENLQKQ